MLYEYHQIAPGETFGPIAEHKDVGQDWEVVPWVDQFRGLLRRRLADRVQAHPITSPEVIAVIRADTLKEVGEMLDRWQLIIEYGDIDGRVRVILITGKQIQALKEGRMP